MMQGRTDKVSIVEDWGVMGPRVTMLSLASKLTKADLP